jgi:hypothetical protein
MRCVEQDIGDAFRVHGQRVKPSANDAISQAGLGNRVIAAA